MKAFSRAAAIALAFLLLLAPLAGCDKTPVQTSVGVRPSWEVRSIDAAADFLKEVTLAHGQAVAAHDARAASESPAEHLAAREALIAFGNGLKASWATLAAVKAGTSPVGPLGAIAPLLASAPAFLDLAVRTRVMSQDTADGIRKFLATVPPPTTEYLRRPLRSPPFRLAYYPGGRVRLEILEQGDWR